MITIAVMNVTCYAARVEVARFRSTEKPTKSNKPKINLNEALPAALLV